MDKTSPHYVGEKGKTYFSGRFTDTQNFGRRYQSLYFAPYCRSDAVLLDYGCGDGTILRELPARGKTGIEVNPYCQERIRALNEGLSPSISVYDTIDDIKERSVDIVVSNHSLEHVLHPFGILTEMWRVLRPSGKLVLVTPYDDWRHKGGRRWTPGDKDNHLYTWSPMNIGNLLVEAGFEVESAQLCETAWTPRIFWIHQFLGKAAFRLACQLVSRVRNRREVLSVARKP